LEKCQICDVSEHNAKSSPHLPLHDKSTTNDLRATFRCEDGHCGRFGTNPKAKGEACNEHMPPGIHKPLPETGQERETAGNKDCAASTKPMIEGDGEPTARDGATEVRSGVHKSD
jgi:hypothetical protein